jgi:hypothetical protein
MATTPTITPAKSDAAPTPDKPLLTQPVSLEQLSDAQHAKWLKTGELPIAGAKEVKTLDQGADKVDADADKAKPGDDGKVDDDAPAQPERGFGSKRPSELRRIAREQQAEIARLKARIAKPADADAAEVEEVEVPAKADAKSAAKATPRPKSTDLDANGKAKYADWEAYEDALLEWNTERVMAKVEESQSKREQERTIAAQNTKIEQSWGKRTEEARKLHEDFDDVALDPDGPGKHISRGSVVDQWILESDLGAEILYHFGSNLDDLLRYGKLSPVAAARELTKLESKLSKSSEQDDSASASGPRKSEVKVTKAPRPASEVGGRGTAAVDDVARALADDPTKSEDAMRRFMAAENRKDIAERLGERRR